MKKIKLNLKNIEGVEELNRAQLKNIFGGTSAPPEYPPAACESATKSCTIPLLNGTTVQGKCGTTPATQVRNAYCSCQKEGQLDYPTTDCQQGVVIPPM